MPPRGVDVVKTTDVSQTGASEMGMTDLPTAPHLATSDDAVGDATYPIAGRFRLADGRLVWLRPLRAEDAPRLMDLCKRLSPSTIRRRFLRSVVRCDPLEAQRLAAVDQVQRGALVAGPDAADDAPGLRPMPFSRVLGSHT